MEGYNKTVFTLPWKHWGVTSGWRQKRRIRAVFKKHNVSGQRTDWGRIPWGQQGDWLYMRATSFFSIPWPGKSFAPPLPWPESFLSHSTSWVFLTGVLHSLLLCQRLDNGVIVNRASPDSTPLSLSAGATIFMLIFPILSEAATLPPTKEKVFRTYFLVKAEFFLSSNSKILTFSVRCYLKYTRDEHSPS